MSTFESLNQKLSGFFKYNQEMLNLDKLFKCLEIRAETQLKFFI